MKKVKIKNISGLDIGVKGLSFYGIVKKQGESAIIEVCEEDAKRLIEKGQFEAVKEEKKTKAENTDN